MPFGLDDALLLGGAAYGAIKGRGAGRRRREDMRRAIAELRASQPVGYLTPEDVRAGEQTRGRLAAEARSQGGLAGVDVSRRSTARGLAGSPSEERALARVGQQTASGVEHAGDTAEEQLYNIRLGREQYGRQKDLAIFGAETGAATQEAQRQSAEEAAYWNSLLEFTPTILGNIDRPAGVTGTTPSTLGFDPGLVRGPLAG